jgi:hypothetical protein
MALAILRPYFKFRRSRAFLFSFFENLKNEKREQKKQKITLSKPKKKARCDA